MSSYERAWKHAKKDKTIIITITIIITMMNQKIYNPLQLSYIC